MTESILERWKNLQTEVLKTCLESGRNPKEVQIIAVSKFQTENSIQAAYQAGCHHFGENRVQEALIKINSFKSLKFSWHFIGTLQKNKVSKVIGQFELIHSVDHVDLAEKISEESLKKNLVTPILLQANLTKEISKHGFEKRQIENSIHHLFKLKGIAIKGLMTIGPQTENQDLIKECFKDLRLLREALRNKLEDFEALPHLSMGMTNDFKEAIQEGATYLRIGSAIFGSRSV